VLFELSTWSGIKYLFAVVAPRLQIVLASALPAGTRAQARVNAFRTSDPSRDSTAISGTRDPGAEQDLEIILLHGASAYRNGNSN
jgi:hypothetical protein